MQQRNEFWQTPVHESSLSQADVLNRLIDEAEAVVVGIGAGMSAATGFTYVGKRFTDAFPDFIENIASSICCRQVFLNSKTGRSIGLFKVGSAY